jgi:RES domain-containing protein
LTDPAQLRQRLAKLPGRKFSARLYRTALDRDKGNIVEIWPSQVHGWRFNPKGKFGALYLSQDPETCIREVFKHIPDPKVFLGRPRVVGLIEVRIQKCLDLTDGKVLAHLGITEEAILSEDSKEALLLAREARLAGFEGILYRSSVDPSRKNIACFKDTMHHASTCRLLKIKTISEKDLVQIVSERNPVS